MRRLFIIPAAPFRAILVCAGMTAAHLALPADQPAGGPAAAEGASAVRQVRGLVYAGLPSGELKLDLYLPSTAKSGALLVWIHGGGWREGSRSFCPLAPLAGEGYAVASISYRFTQQAAFPAQIEDCRAALAWLRAHAAEYGFDPNRIGVCGESAGGLLAALLGTTGEEGGRVQAVVALCPPTDLTLEDAEQAGVEALLASQDAREVARGKTIRYRGASLRAALGGPLEEHRELARRMSPVAHVSPDDPPFLLVHGDRDDLIPLVQSEILHEALGKAGVGAELLVVKGAGHGFGRPKPELMARIKAFFDAHL